MATKTIANVAFLSDRHVIMRFIFTNGTNHDIPVRNKEEFVQLLRRLQTIVDPKTDIMVKDWLQLCEGKQFTV